MPRDPDIYDFFVSYARADNREGWIEQFVRSLVEEHRRFSGGRELKYFFDKDQIPNLSYWETEIFNKGIARSRLFLAFLSPNYFASEVCRKEWSAWIDQEIAKHILTEGAAPIYIVEVPGLISKPPLGEHEVARLVAQLCDIKLDARFDASVSSLVKELRRRQLEVVQPFYNAGLTALLEADLQKTLQRMARDIDERAEHVRHAAESENTVPPYNEKFTGRRDELIEMRRRLKDDRTGVICGIHGLGGIGKTELAYTYAHAFAGAYPGGRFLVRCEGETDLKQAVLRMEKDPFHDEISDEERKDPRAHFAAAVRSLQKRLDDKGHVLLILDNVDHPDVVSGQQTDALTVLGPQLHILATTRLPAPPNSGWLTLGELSTEEAVELLDRYRPIATDEDRAAAYEIIGKLGGFTLAIELIAAGFAAHPSATYTGIALDLGLDDLDTLAEDQDIRLRRHNHEKRLEAVLAPTLAGLKPNERRLMEFVAFLPPDHVPLPWLNALLVDEFPEITNASKWGNPFDEMIHRLLRLALLTRVDEETTAQRQVRVHRLVQELVRKNLTADQRSVTELTIEQVVQSRASAIQDTTNWQETRWELEPLDALARIWDETGNRRAAWLLDQVGLRWHELAAWSRAEPLKRRTLAIYEEKCGKEHAYVGTALNNLAQLLQATNRLSEAESQFRRALAIYEVSYGENHPYVSTVLNNLAQVLQSANRLIEAETYFRRALQISEDHYGANKPEVSGLLNNLAQLLQATNRLDEAGDLYQRALAIDEAAFGLNHPRVAAIVSNLAELCRGTNRLPEAEALYRRALAIDEAAYGPDHPRVASLLCNLAQLFKETNRLKEAEPLYRRALEIDEASYGPVHPYVAAILNNLAQLLQATNRLSEAEVLFRRALEADEASYGPDHPQVAAIMNNLAQVMQAVHRFAEAETLYKRALEIDEQSYGEDHPQVGAILSNLAELKRVTGDPEECEPIYQRALAIYKTSFGPDHPQVAAIMSNLAQVLRTTHRTPEAEAHFRSALVIYEASYGSMHPHVGAILGNLAEVCRTAGRYEEAETLYRRALDIDEASLGPHHSRIAATLNNLALLLWTTNRRKEAEPLYRRAVDILNASLGSAHPQTQTIAANYASLLQEMQRMPDAN